MEALFEDIYTLEKDKVRLAAHCLKGPARSWWTRVKNGRSLDPATMTWEAFREILLMEYFPESDKRKIKENFRKLRQGGRTVREYEREFSHMVNCVPGLVHGDRDWAEVFERGLRPEIFKTVQALRLKTYEEVLDRALWIERGNAIAREEREAFERDKDREKSKKRPAGGSVGQMSSKRPPRHPRSQWQRDRSQTRSQMSPFPCIICGGNHRPSECSQHDGRCFRCGQAGHMRWDCPGGASPAPSAASAQYAPRQLAGLPPAMSAGRASSLRPPEGSRAPSGRVFGTQVESSLLYPTTSWQVLF
ncbi:uncharacterized protein LOC109704824 [Ananas comosus]|uniref:Uncharacterized protein LOC109704824 n=1 Tax=Ananas comosus TaxID=4615 RepID=A0A6P5ECT2_ANACO|nr:uncharacterized protein LOC109704824 [Ananas comosus]